LIEDLKFRAQPQKEWLVRFNGDTEDERDVLGNRASQKWPAITVRWCIVLRYDLIAHFADRI
jgi:hypothetical protein